VGTSPGWAEVWEKWPLIASPHAQDYIRFLFAMSSENFRFIFACPPGQVPALEIPPSGQQPIPPRKPILAESPLRGGSLAEVGILIIDDDVASQRALKHVLDSEGWRVRILPVPSLALAELASGQWNLVIVNVALIDLRGPLYAILKELAQAEIDAPIPEDAPPGLAPDGPVAVSQKRLRALFLVPAVAARQAQPLLERDGLPYSLKPYHLHDFLEKVSELLVEAGAIADPIRSIGGFGVGARKLKRARRVARDGRRGAMFASREDYQMTEEELTDWERQEEEERKKREKEQKEREHR
jgi:CheY-like chemotaxis protein